MKLALDAGHYKYTPGRRVMKEYDPEEHREWWLNQRICNYIQQYALEYNDFSVLRCDDPAGEIDTELLERAGMANRWGADLFYSAHHNGGIHGGNGGGITAYAHANGTESSSWRDGLYDALIKATGLKGNRSSPRAVAQYTVLTATKMPAVLIEHGFMDSPSDIPVILSEDFAQKCARAVVEYIAQRCGLTKKNNNKPEPEPIKPPVAEVTYTVKSGDTLESIAKQYNVSAMDIATMNLIVPGKTLVIPKSDGDAPEEETEIVPLKKEDKVKLKKNAVWYNGKAIASWLFDKKELYVREVTSYPKVAISTIKDPNGAITGRIDAKYLERL